MSGWWWLLIGYFAVGAIYATWMLYQSLARFFAAGWRWKRMTRWWVAWAVTWPGLPFLYLMTVITGEE